jgi:16S rRNA (guanine1207-N2)-methyltransferase
LLEVLRDKIRPPLAVVLGAPRKVAEWLAELSAGDTTCYHMDLYQAERLRVELAERGLGARIVVAGDLWDLPVAFQTVLYPTAQGDERELKIDMVEQALPILRPGGALIVTSPYRGDQLFPALLKKVFGRHHATTTAEGAVLWCHRQGDRPRRRHEVTFSARTGKGPSLRFLSRPGVFSYGRFDAGARALVETMIIEEGDKVIDIGCGCGTNGVFAGRRSGPAGHVVFVDSNVRAVALADYNARANGLCSFEAVASHGMEKLPAGGFDVALANPPYYAQGSIAHFFIERARVLLRPEGRLYVVTKQADQIGPYIADHFGRTEVIDRRGYAVLCALCP